MTAQPARIDLADLGPGVAWAFEFDENGRGRLLEGNSSFDLTRGRRFVWVHLILGNVRTRDWIGAQDVLPPAARGVFLSRDRRTAGSDRRPRFVGRVQGRKRDASVVAKRHFSPGATGSGRSQRAEAT